MQGFRLVAIVGLTILFCGCKVAVEVGDGGEVVTRSGTYHCAANESCVIDVSTTAFNETFIANPEQGYYFAGWKKRDNGFCGNSDTPCDLSTAGFLGNDALLEILESDRVFYLEPDFKKAPEHWNELDSALALVSDQGLRDCIASNSQGFGYVEQLKKLSCKDWHEGNLGFSWNIESFKGIELFTRLESFEVDIGFDTDVASIVVVPSLTKLHINETGGVLNTVEPGFLRNAQNLRSLELIGVRLSDPSVLGSLVNLRHLNLTSAAVTDPSIYESLTKLESLILARNIISDVEFIRPLKNLKHLDLSFNDIADEDLLTIRSIAGLRSLKLYWNSIADVSPLRKLTRLEHLNFGGNQVVDISALGTLTQLRSLSVSGNDILDFGVLNNLVNLKILSLDISERRHAAPLSGLKHLEELYIYVGGDKGSNGFPDGTSLGIGFLGNLGKLRKLLIHSAGIDSLGPIPRLKNLEYLDLRHNRITSLKGIGRLSRLQQFNLNHNAEINRETGWVSELDIEELSKLSSILYLSLEGNGIREISSFDPPSSLLQIHLDYNSITVIDNVFSNIRDVVVSLYGNPLDCERYFKEVERLRELGNVPRFTSDCRLW